MAAVCALAATVAGAGELSASLLWKRTGEESFSDPVVSRGVVFVGSEDRTLSALDGRTGETLWAHRTQGAVHGTPLVTATHVYFESDDRTLYKLDRIRGERVWSFRIPGTQPVLDPQIFFHHTTSTPVLRDGRLYFGSGNGRFYCLNDADGSKRWSFEAAGRIRSAPVLVDGRVIVAGFGPVVYALDEQTGALAWERMIPPPDERPFWPKVLPSPVAHGGLVFMGFRDGSLRAFEAESGEERWLVRYEESWVEATGLVVDGRLYVGSSDAALVRCYDTSNGEILWETNVGGRAYGRPSRFGRFLIFGLSGAAPNNAHLESGAVALALEDGRVAWKLSLPRPESGGEFVPYGVLGHTSVEGSVLCFSDESGSLYAYELRE